MKRTFAIVAVVTLLAGATTACYADDVLLEQIYGAGVHAFNAGDFAGRMPRYRRRSKGAPMIRAPIIFAAWRICDWAGKKKHEPIFKRVLNLNPEAAPMCIRSAVRSNAFKVLHDSYSSNIA